MIVLKKTIGTAKNTLSTTAIVNKVFQPRCGHLISQIYFATSELSNQHKMTQNGGGFYDSWIK